MYHSTTLNTQNGLLMTNLMEFYQNKDHLHKMMCIINGESKISLRLVDWFVTNFAKKQYTVYELQENRRSTASSQEPEQIRFKVYNDYKLKLKAYSKRKFDPFCRWDRISIPYGENSVMETTIGQLNFFKWAIEHKIMDYIETHYQDIENDMNNRNSTAKRRVSIDNLDDLTASQSSVRSSDMTKTRKKREELSISACKCIKKELVKIVVKFN
jgi:hypothetical protein